MIKYTPNPRMIHTGFQNKHGSASVTLKNRHRSAKSFPPSVPVRGSTTSFSRDLDLERAACFAGLNMTLGFGFSLNPLPSPIAAANCDGNRLPSSTVMSRWSQSVFFHWFGGHAVLCISLIALWDTFLSSNMMSNMPRWGLCLIRAILPKREKVWGDGVWKRIQQKPNGGPETGFFFFRKRI